MDPFTAGIAVTAYLGQKALSYAEDKFGKSVIQRWTRHRSEQFFNAFISEISKEIGGDTAAHVDECLDAMFADATKSEILFDAYRRVSFAAGKTFGLDLPMKCGRGVRVIWPART